MLSTLPHSHGEKEVVRDDDNLQPRHCLDDDMRYNDDRYLEELLVLVRGCPGVRSLEGLHLKLVGKVVVCNCNCEDMMKNLGNIPGGKGLE